jgi:hypothetical protein
VRRRLSLHNSAVRGHTAKFKPWDVVAVVELRDAHTALAFERYLKSGSGRAFAKRHFGAASTR